MNPKAHQTTYENPRPFTRLASIDGFWQMMLYPAGPDDLRKEGSLSYKS